MARRRRRTTQEDHGGGGGHGGASARWLVSYSDFITLMFVVFVVLFSFANIDLTKYKALGESLRGAMGPTGPDLTSMSARGMTGQAMPIIPPDRPGNIPDVPDWPTAVVGTTTEGERAPIPPAETPPADAKPSANRSDPVSAPAKTPVTPPKSTPPPDELGDLTAAFQALPGSRTGLLQVALEERGIVLSIAGNLLFEPGQTALKPVATAYLDQVAGKLAGVEMPIMVEGTADETATPNVSPWDLAALRAGAVVRYFVQQKGLPGSHFVTIGYGNGTGSDPDAERRVTIIVMRKKTTQ
jgi:chemotaxis protein MotB